MKNDNTEKSENQSNLDGVLEEIADYRDIDWHCHCWRDSGFDPEEFSEGSLININKEGALTLWRIFEGCGIINIFHKSLCTGSACWIIFTVLHWNAEWGLPIH